MKSLFLISLFFIYVKCQLSGQFGIGVQPYGQQPLYGQQNQFGLQQQYPGQLNNGFGLNNGGAQCLFGPLTPLNGRLQFSTGSVLGPYPSGSIVTNQCNPGYMPNGISQATCLNGQWSPPTLGECILGQQQNLGFNNQFGK
uniref:Sushi domain-containing protein n=1 Tax=Panagrolaimus sp. ES5 TaxID=591445 RepID=A0AC34FLV4_9BILA